MRHANSGRAVAVPRIRDYGADGAISLAWSAGDDLKGPTRPGRPDAMPLS